MAIEIRRRVKALLHLRRGKKRRLKHCNSGSQGSGSDESERKVVVEESVGFSKQPDSMFFRQLPIEIRKIVYSYIWRGTYDHMYHEPNGRHICFKDGRWVNMRCVMSEADEDPDLIQKNMDYIRGSGHGNLRMWQRRLSSTWGSRHWRCEERIEYGQLGAIDRTDFTSMMLVCKRMCPEVVESIFESHKFIFNDLYSAYRFFVCHPSPHLSHLRHLDLTLNMRFYECSPVVINTPKNRVKGVLDSIKLLPCLHNLRVSLDICDRGPWRKLPERDLMTYLGKCNVFGEFIVELPPRETTPFAIVRRPPLRYWEFNIGEVERFQWETFQRGDQPHCRITLAKSGMAISNPWWNAGYSLVTCMMVTW